MKTLDGGEYREHLVPLKHGRIPKFTIQSGEHSQVFGKNEDGMHHKEILVVKALRIHFKYKMEEMRFYG